MGSSFFFFFWQLQGRERVPYIIVLFSGGGLLVEGMTFKLTLPLQLSLLLHIEELAGQDFIFICVLWMNEAVAFSS